MGKGINYREIRDKFGVTASTVCEKVNTSSGNGENLFRLVPAPELCVRVLPLELVPMAGHGAQICAREPTKDYVQTGTRAWVPSLYGAQEIVKKNETLEVRESCLPSFHAAVSHAPRLSTWLALLHYPLERRVRLLIVQGPREGRGRGVLVLRLHRTVQMMFYGELRRHL